MYRRTTHNNSIKGRFAHKNRNWRECRGRSHSHSGRVDRLSNKPNSTIKPKVSDPTVIELVKPLPTKLVNTKYVQSTRETINNMKYLISDCLETAADCQSFDNILGFLHSTKHELKNNVPNFFSLPKTKVSYESFSKRLVYYSNLKSTKVITNFLDSIKDSEIKTAVQTMINALDKILDKYVNSMVGIIIVKYQNTMPVLDFESNEVIQSFLGDPTFHDLRDIIAKPLTYLQIASNQFQTTSLYTKYNQITETKLERGSNFGLSSNVEIREQPQETDTKSDPSSYCRIHFEHKQFQCSYTCHKCERPGLHFSYDCDVVCSYCSGDHNTKLCKDSFKHFIGYIKYHTHHSGALGGMVALDHYTSKGLNFHRSSDVNLILQE